MRPSNVHFFGPLKKHRTGKLFAAGSDEKQAVTSLLQTHDANFYYLFYFGIRVLIAQWRNILNINGDYVEVWCVSSAIQLTWYAFRLKTKFLASECLLDYCFELIDKSPASLYRSTNIFSVDLRHIKSETEFTATYITLFSWTLELYFQCRISLYFLFTGCMCGNACSCCTSRLPGRWICRIFRPHYLCGPCLSCHPHICCASHCKGPCRIQGSSCRWLLRK